MHYLVREACLFVKENVGTERNRGCENFSLISYEFQEYGACCGECLMDLRTIIRFLVLDKLPFHS